MCADAEVATIHQRDVAHLGVAGGGGEGRWGWRGSSGRAEDHVPVSRLPQGCAGGACAGCALPRSLQLLVHRLVALYPHLLADAT